MEKFKHVKINNMKPIQELESFSKYAASEGMVLLKNDQNVLPIINKKVAIFGRIQFNYYKSGTGSGGLVNAKYVQSIIEALLNNPRITIDNKIYNLYKNWILENPFNEGDGSWASEPWSQIEMPIDEKEIITSSQENDIAVIFLGRTAGEERDNQNLKGSYYLSDLEDELINKVTKHYKKTVVVLNVGNLIDLSFLDKYKVDSLLLSFHGGIYGQLALSEILTGYKSPSAKLPFSIAYNLNDYPSSNNFGNHNEVIYEEDIYVGYRYFETFNQNKVRYPFGYGLTYSKFEINYESLKVNENLLDFKFSVKNIGDFNTKEVVQLYVEKPQGLLGKPKYELVGFLKTNELMPGIKNEYNIKINLDNLVSYDDYGYISKSSYILEKGNYHFYLGNSLNNIKLISTYKLKENKIYPKLNEINPPNKLFKRLRPNNNLQTSFEEVPLRTIDYLKNIENNIKDPIKKNNKNYNLIDVYNKKITLDEFIGSLNDDDLIHLTRGEGMSSPKVTLGTAAAFGGVTPNLLNKGIPILCAADGPSGIRMDSGFYATSIPIGLSLASSFNEELVEMLYYLVGLEMRSYKIDLLLAPGMNIIRHPLNGRNFEYFSEDPLLTGIMGAKVIQGLKKAGVSGSLKHVYANNQETDRFNVNAVISERAQREIYLKGFEIAVKMGQADAIMTSYNPVNGIWSASNYDINKTLIKEEWGFKGIIITDWWAKMNDYQEDATKTNTKAMIKSQGDIYMVVVDAFNNSLNDNTKESLINGSLKISELQVVAQNILSFIIKTIPFYKMHNLNYKINPINHYPYFETKKNKIIFNYLKENKDYNNNPLIFVKNKIDLKNIKTSNLNIELNKENSYGMIKTEGTYENLIYHFDSDTFSKAKETLIDLNKYKDANYYSLNESVWQENIILLNSFIHKTPGIIIDDVLNITTKNNQITYPLLIKENAKYIIHLKISSTNSSLQQIPFSIYINNLHKTTLTIHGTNNQIVETKGFLLFEKGKNLITFKFIQSNLKIHEIKLLRHG